MSSSTNLPAVPYSDRWGLLTAEGFCRLCTHNITKPTDHATGCGGFVLDSLQVRLDGTYPNEPGEEPEEIQVTARGPTIGHALAKVLGSAKGLLSAEGVCNVALEVELPQVWVPSLAERDHIAAVRRVTEIATVAPRLKAVVSTQALHEAAFKEWLSQREHAESALQAEQKDLGHRAADLRGEIAVIARNPSWLAGSGIDLTKKRAELQAELDAAEARLREIGELLKNWKAASWREREALEASQHAALVALVTGPVPPEPPEPPSTTKRRSRRTRVWS